MKDHKKQEQKDGEKNRKPEKRKITISVRTKLGTEHAVKVCEGEEREIQKTTQMKQMRL